MRTITWRLRTNRQIRPDEVLARLQRRVPHILTGADRHTTIEALPLDSLDLVELLCATDDEFGVRLTTKAFMKARTVDDLLQAISKRAPAAKAAS
jgi:acyl carrier protein